MFAAAALLGSRFRPVVTGTSGGSHPESLEIPLEGWPVDVDKLTRIGDDARVLRSSGPHHGVDLLVPAGSEVVAPEAIRIIRVVNGTAGGSENARRAGLWVDGRGKSGRVLRFLHLLPGSVNLKAGQLLTIGQVVGKVAPIMPPHLHFEVRRADWDGKAYGPAINPVEVLPNIGPPAVLRRLAALRQPGRGSLS